MEITSTPSGSPDLPSTPHHFDLYSLFVATDDTPPPSPYAILILNSPLNTAALSVLLTRASLLVCADGGANRYLEYQRSFQQHDSLSPTIPRNPDAIVGDLDSVHPQVLAHYKSQGTVAIVKDPDLYAPDFTKCLRYIAKHGGRTSTSHHNHTHNNEHQHNTKKGNGKDDKINVLAFGGLGGRVDQGFSQLHHLCLVAEQYQGHSHGHGHGGRDTLSPTNTSPSIDTARPQPQAEAEEKRGKGINRLHLISEQSLSFVLPPGESHIRVGPIEPPSPLSCFSTPLFLTSTAHPAVFTENTGIIPLTGPSVVTTTGFEWDVTDWPTRLGGQVSTSNHLKAEVVTVDVKRGGEGKGGMCLFTVELVAGLCGGS